MCFYGSVAKPKEVFGDGTPHFHAFHKANYEVAPGACEYLELLRNCWQPYVLEHCWDLPDGWHVRVPVMQEVDTRIEVDELDGATFKFRHEINEGDEEGITLIANTTHSVDGMVVREMCRRCNYDVHQLEYVLRTILSHFQNPTLVDGAVETPRIERLATESGFVSLVAVEHIHLNNVHTFSDVYLEKVVKLIKRTLKRKSFPLVTIHDEFKAHANNMNVVRQTYIDIMAEIADSNMLSFLLTQIRGEYTEINKFSDNLGDLIREAEYPLS